MKFNLVNQSIFSKEFMKKNVKSIQILNRDYLSSIDLKVKYLLIIGIFNMIIVNYKSKPSIQKSDSIKIILLTVI